MYGTFSASTKYFLFVEVPWIELIYVRSCLLTFTWAPLIIHVNFNLSCQDEWKSNLVLKAKANSRSMDSLFGRNLIGESSLYIQICKVVFLCVFVLGPFTHLSDPDYAYLSVMEIWIERKKIPPRTATFKL